jgi:serine/threonine protein kinase
MMEYVENRNLLEYVSQNVPLGHEQARHYFAQLVSVLEYLYGELKVTHRGSKCENVLLDRYGALTNITITIIIISV